MPKPYTLVFANCKGGVGKTTTCLSIGCCLAQMGHNTLMIEFDHQCNLSNDLGRGGLAVNEQGEIQDFNQERTTTDLFENPKTDINSLIYSALDGDQPIENLSIMPADLALSSMARNAMRFRHRDLILADALKGLKPGFEFILIDLPPAIDLTVETALYVADQVIIPIDMCVRAVKGIEDFLQVVWEVRRGEEVPFMLVKTKVNRAHKTMYHAVDALIKSYDYPVASTEIRTSELYRKASKERRPVIRHTKSKAKTDYWALTQELLGVNHA